MGLLADIDFFYCVSFLPFCIIRINKDKWRQATTQKNRAVPKSLKSRTKFKLTNMKTLAFVSGALFCSLTVLGILFKIQHWPGASVLLVLGLGIFSLLFIPSITKYLYSKAN